MMFYDIFAISPAYPCLSTDKTTFHTFVFLSTGLTEGWRQNQKCIMVVEVSGKRKRQSPFSDFFC